MKSLTEFMSTEYIKSLDFFCEEDSAPATTTAGVTNSDQPMFKVKRDKFMGHLCLEVDDDTYCGCMKGKVPFSRWSGYIDDEATRTEVQSSFYKNKRLLIRNEKTGAMVYIK